MSLCNYMGASIKYFVGLLYKMSKNSENAYHNYPEPKITSSYRLFLSIQHFQHPALTTYRSLGQKLAVGAPMFVVIW